MSFNLSFKFALVDIVTTIITIQQIFQIMCNNCSYSAFETHLKLNSNEICSFVENQHLVVKIVQVEVKSKSKVILRINF
jgi:hypothetical protein